MGREVLTMLKLINITVNGNIAEMLVLVEGKENMAYHMSVDLDSERFSIITSEVPDEYKMYERQARIALLRYKGKEIPAIVSSMWY